MPWQQGILTDLPRFADVIASTIRAKLMTVLWMLTAVHWRYLQKYFWSQRQLSVQRLCQCYMPLCSTLFSMLAGMTFCIWGLDSCGMGYFFWSLHEIKCVFYQVWACTLGTLKHFFFRFPRAFLHLSTKIFSQIDKYRRW